MASCSEIPHDLSVRHPAQPTPSGEVDAVFHEAHAAVGQKDVDAARVAAARGREIRVLAALNAGQVVAGGVVAGVAARIVAGHAGTSGMFVYAGRGGATPVILLALSSLGIRCTSAIAIGS